MAKLVSSKTAKPVTDASAKPVTDAALVRDLAKVMRAEERNDLAFHNIVKSEIAKYGEDAKTVFEGFAQAHMRGASAQWVKENETARAAIFYSGFVEALKKAADEVTKGKPDARDMRARLINPKRKSLSLHMWKAGGAPAVAKGAATTAPASGGRTWQARQCD